MKEIIQKGNPILRDLANKVPVEEITSSDIKTIIKDLKETLDNSKEGLALAAPQIGVSLRIFLISKRIFTIDENGNPLSEEELGDIDNYKDLIFINPEITNQSKKTQWLTEGCLSIRGVYGKVERSEKVTIRAFNEKGEVFTRGASSLLAQTIQHENDHLYGVLFCDKAKDLEKVEIPNNEK